MIVRGGRDSITALYQGQLFYDAMRKTGANSHGITTAKNNK
jgi:hypothetical protein